VTVAGWSLGLPVLPPYVPREHDQVLEVMDGSERVLPRSFTSLIVRFPARRLCRRWLHEPFPVDPVNCFLTASFQAKMNPGDFLCYDSQSRRGGDDPVAQFPGALGPVLRSLSAPHRGLSLHPLRRNPGRGVLKHGHEPAGLLRAGGQQVS